MGKGNNKYINVPQLFSIMRNNKLLTSERLCELFDQNNNIKSTLLNNNTDFIAQTLINELIYSSSSSIPTSSMHRHSYQGGRGASVRI